jgi:hypothetical protein
VSQDKATSTITSIYTVAKSAALGLLLSETWYFAKAFRPALAAALTQVGLDRWDYALGVFGLIVLGTFLVAEGFHRSLLLVLRSARIDLFLALVLGVLLSIAFGGVWTHKYEKWAAGVAPTAIGVAVLAPLVIIAAFLVGRLMTWFKAGQPKPQISPLFLNDEALTATSDDLLDVAEKAGRFAERVLNGGSSNNMVFGIDAPWGIGKSTFINFCKEYWLKGPADRVLVYEFNPLRYEGSTSLAENFVDGLIRTIQRRAFIPELQRLISTYSRFIKGAKTKLSVFDLEFPSGGYTIDDAYLDLESALGQLDTKIIVIIDDLDRLSLSAAMTVLYTIKKGFALPNVSYVLAYDTGNMGALDANRPDADKLIEFLEKFINVKTSIYLESAALVRYMSEYLAKALSGNSQADPVLISTAMGGLIDILRGPDYHKYQPFVGDIRKIKRLINTLLLLDIENVDFANSDFNKEDLIRLLLIYINYPSVFRTLYDTETEGRMGAFSVLGPHDRLYPFVRDEKGKGEDDASFKNSQWYTDYSGKLRESQRALVDSVFKVPDRLSGQDSKRIDEAVKRSYACFNGGGGSGRNLEEYLHLIVRLSKPQNSNQHRFYLNCKNRIATGVPIEDVLAEYAEFSPTASERNRAQLWRVIVNSVREFSGEIGKRLIRHLLDNMSDYCSLQDEGLGLGLRHSLPLFAIKLLDAVGWQDDNGQALNNSDEHVLEIAEWILGEKRHVDGGVVETLAEDKKGVLGLNDLMMFRLYCSADRGGDTFNVQRALARYRDRDAPTSGLTTTIAVAEMRDISQLVYQTFKRLYIDRCVNLFEVVDRLLLKDFCGVYSPFVEAEAAKGALKDLASRLDTLKSQVKVFVIYQLGNARVEFGVGCGYYDPEGRADKHGISSLINEYIFGVCFDPKVSAGNYGHFLDYMLMNFTSTFGTGRRNYVPTAEEFTKVLQRERLAEYWRMHREAIRVFGLTKPEKVVRTANYTVSYATDLEAVFAVLDGLIGDAGPGQPAVTA